MAGRKSFSAKEKALIFLAGGGKCWLCGVRLIAEDWEIEHKLALGLGGTNDIENLAPAHPRKLANGEPGCHAAKTRRDVKMIAKAKRISAKRLGTKQSATPLPGGKRSKWKRKMDGTVVLR